MREMENFNSSRIAVAADQRRETTSDTSSPAFNYELAHLHFFLFFLVCLPRHSQRCTNSYLCELRVRVQPWENYVHREEHR